MKRIATRLKKDSMVTMPDWPEEKCSEVPQRIQGIVSVKRRKRRVINIPRKFHADLSNGMLKFFSRKKVGVAAEPEFQIDLAKATVMYDDKRIVLVLKVANETHSLIPIEDSLDRWRDAILKHRLYRQEAVRKGLQPDSAHTLETISGTGQSDEKGWESHGSSKIFEEVNQVQGLTLEILDKLTKTYEEMKKTNEDLKNSLKNIRDALMIPADTTSAWTNITTSLSPSQMSTIPRSSTIRSTTIPSSTIEGTSSSMDSKANEASESEDEDDENYDKKDRKSSNKK